MPDWVLYLPFTALGGWACWELRRIARKLHAIDVELQLRRADREREHRARLLIRDNTDAIRKHLTGSGHPGLRGAEATPPT